MTLFTFNFNVIDMLRLLAKSLLLLVLCVGLSELSIHTVLRSHFEGTDKLIDFYSEYHNSAASGPLNIVFVGTSRVAGSVSSNLVSKILSESLNRNMRVINAGKGFSSLAIHYFGLQNLYRDHPDNMHEAIVMIEAPSGILLYAEWNDNWVVDEWPVLMSPMLTSDNLFQFIRNSSSH